MRALTRRYFVVRSASAFSAASLFGGFGLTSAAAAPHQQQKRSAAQWMDEWISRARDVEGALYVGRFVEPIYFLTKPIAWKPNPGQEQYNPVSVPIGFVTDFASIPQAFWSLLRPDGEYAYAAVIHDYLYWTQDRPRSVADQTFKFAMQDFEINAVTANTIYSAVRVAGGSAWNDNAKLKASGELRVLKRFPDDPRTRWADWKKLPDVFDQPKP